MKKNNYKTRTVPEYKKELVKKIAEKIKDSRTVLIASTKCLPSSQFHKIKKSLRGKVEIIVAKKSIVLRAISNIEKGAPQNLKEQIGANICIMFSELEAFELASLLNDNQSPTKAKAGDTAPEDINVEPGPTNLVPGPAISELGSVGLKVSVENGKLAIKQGATIVKTGEIISAKVAGVMSKLNIEPMKVGFIPLAAYDVKSGTIYTEINIDKEATVKEMEEMIIKALGFAVNVGYAAKETVGYFIMKAIMEEKTIEKIIEKKNGGENE